MGMTARADSQWRYLGYQADGVAHGQTLSAVSHLGRTWLVDYHLRRISGYSELPVNRMVWTTYPTEAAFQEALKRVGSELQEERRRADRRRRDRASGAARLTR